MSKPARYQRVSQSQEKEESDNEDTTLFDKDFGEGLYEEDEEDLEIQAPKPAAPRKVPRRIHQFHELKNITPIRNDWLCRFLAVSVVVLSLLLIALLLTFIFLQRAPVNCSSSYFTNQGISWEKELFPGYTESSLEPQDMNGDGNKDIVMAHITGHYSEMFAICPGKPDLCQEEQGYSPCRVHVIALCGTKGDIIWDKWIDFETYALRCSHDLNGDQVPDCIVAGRMGSFAAISGADASFLWLVDKALVFPKYNFYYPLIVEDMDNDGVVDLINIHSGDPSYRDEDADRSPGFMVVVSGRTGQQLMERVQIPDGHESYSSPILYHHPDGTPVVVFGTGGETVSGSLWAVTLKSIKQRVQNYHDAHKDEINNYVTNVTYFDPSCYNFEELEHGRPQELPGLFDSSKDWKTAPVLSSLCPPTWGDKTPIWNPLGLCVYKLLGGSQYGTIQPPVVMEMTGDDVKDLIVSQFGEHTILLDGKTGSVVWDLHIPDTQTYSIPAPILFNSDDTYDLVIRINKGKWMVYDYSYIAIADGKTGSLLWTFNSSQAVMTSAITVHNKNKGQDGVLFISIGQSPEQSKTESETRKSMNKRGTCARGYVEEELKTCASSEQKRRKRHQNDQDGDTLPPNGAPPPNGDAPPPNGDAPPPPNDSGPPPDMIPQDLWEQSTNDSFPDPWSETESFIEDYCGYSMEAISSHVYFLTPDLINEGNLKPLHTFKPYVFDPKSFPMNMRAKRHGPPSQENANSGNESMDNRHKLRCAHIVMPMMMASTPAIEDLNNDGRLDVSLTILWSGAPGEFSNLMMIHPPKVIVKTFTLEDRVKEVYGSDVKIDFSSYLPSSEQPWKKYMGSQSTGEFSLN